MTFMWLGTNFAGYIFVPSMFFTDANNNYYYYDQNYNGFYDVITDGESQPTLPSVELTSLPISSILTSAPDLANYVPSISNQIIHNKLSSYLGDSINVLNSYTQNPSAFVANTLTNSLTGTNYSAALAQVAPLLTSPSINFSFNEILNSYQDGEQIINSLFNSLSLFQNFNITGLTGASQSISDFKKKILRQTTAVADEVRKAQGALAQYSGQNSFSALSSAIPGFSTITSTINNATAGLGTSITNLLPSTGNINNTAGQLFNQFAGGLIRQIMNPLDIFLEDITNLDNIVAGISTNIPTFNAPSSGFPSPQAQAVALNQVVNSLSNVVGGLPTLPNIPIPTQATNINQIFSTVAQYAESVLQTNTGQNNPQQQAVNTLLSLMKNSSPTPGASTNTTVASAIIQDPYGGGSFTNTPGLSGVLNEPDPTVQPPNVYVSPDPTVQSQQNNTASAQTAANAPGIYQNYPQGSGINIFEDVPLTPRCITTDGSLGDYTSDIAIPI